MESTAATAALEGRYAALRACADQLSSDELLDVIELAQREKDAASARQAVALAHLSARDAHRQEDGMPAEVHHGLGYQRLDGPELAAPRLGCSVFVATNRILDAIRQLTRTPAVVDAMASGDLDEHRARVVTEETEFLSAQSAAEVVDRVKDVWGQLTVGPLRQLLARTAALVDPDAVTAHVEDERARRGLTRRTGVNGTDHWRGDFRVEDARGAWAAVTERARQLVRENKAHSLELARADAMMELILEHSDVKVIVHTTRAADDGDTTATTADTNTAAASGAAEDLVEVGGLGQGGTTFVRREWLDNAGVSDPDGELTCDTTTGALLHGDVPAALARGQARARRAHRKAERSGQNLEDFSQSYRVPDGMVRLIRLRDGNCRFPGCTVPARQCDLDHVRPWPTGPTSPINLMCLCRRHHRIKQRDGWTVTLHPDGTVTWIDPTGLQRTTWPVDHLHLVTAGATHRDPSTAGRIAGDPTDIPTTFEEELIELLGGPDNAQPRAYPFAFDMNGNTFGGPPPRIDLDFNPSWNRYRIDFPPRPPRPPQPIPF
ncbi:HNH endonuclease signature motif containing protein [Knoellia pratensis]|uniref:HNH endonuclease signature motif containing protein n=1 Tax=Knoellia pratensis TaxID=3404796 RepID=UPI00361B6A92